MFICQLMFQNWLEWHVRRITVKFCNTTYFNDFVHDGEKNIIFLQQNMWVNRFDMFLMIISKYWDVLEAILILKTIEDLGQGTFNEECKPHPKNCNREREINSYNVINSTYISIK